MLEQINEIKYLFFASQITHAEAVQKLKPLIDNYNSKGREIAKKHARRFKPLPIIGLLR